MNLLSKARERMADVDISPEEAETLNLAILFKGGSYLTWKNKDWVFGAPVRLDKETAKRYTSLKELVV